MLDPAIVLFAHGSRDPSWSAPIEAVARRTRALAPGREVRCAYLELTEPTLAEACADLVACGARQVRIVPMFLGVGRHAREDLPVLVQALRRAHPDIEFQLQPAVGENDRLIEALAQLALT